MMCPNWWFQLQRREEGVNTQKHSKGETTTPEQQKEVKRHWTDLSLRAITKHLPLLPLELKNVMRKNGDENLFEQTMFSDFLYMATDWRKWMNLISKYLKVIDAKTYHSDFLKNKEKGKDGHTVNSHYVKGFWSSLKGRWWKSKHCNTSLWTGST